MTSAGLSIPIEIRRRKGTRHLRLSLGFQNQIVTSAPWHVGDRSVAKFVESQRSWVETQLLNVPKVYSLIEWLKVYPRVSAGGDVFELRIENTTRRRADYYYDAGGALLAFRLPESSEASLRKLFRKYAADVLGCRVGYHASRLGLRYSKLTVRDQSSRWGSCSQRRTISLNWRLLFLRPRVQDYVILHELAHLTEMNHGKRFWDLLDSYDTDRIQHEAELDSVSAELMRVAR